MIKKFVGIIMCAALVLMSTLAFAGDVAVMKRGKKYHATTCPLLVGKKIVLMDEQQALAKGLKPCPKCLKDKVKDAKVDEDPMPAQQAN